MLAGIFAAIAVVLSVFLIYPLLSDIQRGSQEILISRVNVVNSELQNQELDRFQKGYKNYQPNFAKADALIVDAKDPINFIKFLETTAANSGVTGDIKLISSHQQTLNNWPVSVFEIVSNGSFSGMMVFSEKLETGPYITSIQNMALKKHQDFGDANSKTVTGAIDADILVQVVTN
jgi:hypothetical protein